MFVKFKKSKNSELYYLNIFYKTVLINRKFNKINKNIGQINNPSKNIIKCHKNKSPRKK